MTNKAKTKKAGILFIRGLDKELKATFKAHCARRGQTMTEVISALMREALRSTGSC